MTSWDLEADVVVVGYGAAGAAAAIEALDGGASVIVLDRFNGGGASAISGGVVYAGGGTPYQREAGFQDTPENMYRYLELETEGVVRDETLRRFCDESVANLEWLEHLGVPFESSLCPFKTSYPTDDYYLYYSGNEIVRPYCDHAQPVPRGHRAKGKGTSGKVLFAHLDEGAQRRGVTLRRQAKVTRLITEGGRAVGVEYQTLPLERARLRAVQARLFKHSRKLTLYAPPIGRAMSNAILRIERKRYTETIRVRARVGVVVSAGGFAFNREWVERYAPEYIHTRPLGTIGDDGSGIELAQSVGGAVDRMEKISAWRFFNPPVSMVRGVLVNKAGERVCNELLYGANVGRAIAEDHGGIAWLVLDQAVLDQAKSEVPSQTSLWQRAFTAPMFTRLGHKRRSTLRELADAIGVDPAGLERTIADYSDRAGAGEGDVMGKPDEYVQPLTNGPFYAINCSMDASVPCPGITLGGAVVDEDTGLVQRADGSTIDGLYAAGRSAVGISSHSYVSGLSLSDCIFSGRRAGRHAAAQALKINNSAVE